MAASKDCTTLCVSHSLGCLQTIAVTPATRMPMIEKHPALLNTVRELLIEGEETKRESALGVTMCLAADVETHGSFFALPGFVKSVVDVIRLPEKVNENGKDYTRNNAVIIMSHFARTRDFTVELCEAGSIGPLMDCIKLAGSDTSTWRGGDAPEFWASCFFMNLAQDPEAVAPLRVNGLVDLLKPLLQGNNRNSLVASATVAFLVGSDMEGEVSERSEGTNHA